MNRLRWGIDLDGCAYRWSDTAAYLLNAHKGYDLGESTYWDYIPDRVSPDDWEWLWTEGIERYGLFHHGNCYPGTFDALDTLAGLGDVVIITSRPACARRSTMRWLGFHEVPVSELHILTSPGERKSDVRPWCDLYVDDSEKNVVDLHDHTTGTVLLMDRPWNRDVTTAGNRVSGWPEVVSWARAIRYRRCLEE